jgi:hypothetical protein
MRAIIGLVDSQKKVPPSAPTVSLAEDTGSNRDFDNGAASLTWTTPTFNGKSAIVGYDITATDEDNATVTFSTGVVNNASITGLKSGKKYTYKIKARNGGGSGSDSAGRGPVTSTTKPNIPLNVTATNLNNGSQATVSWTAGANGGSPITGYTITTSPGGATTTTSSTNITVGSLTNGSSYTFTVTATNVNGTSSSSNASSPITITQPVVVPTPPPQTGCTSCYNDSGQSYCSGSSTVINQIDNCCGRGTIIRTISGNPLGCGAIAEVFPCPTDSGTSYCSGNDLVINRVDLCFGTPQSPRVVTANGCVTTPPVRTLLYQYTEYRAQCCGRMLIGVYSDGTESNLGCQSSCGGFVVTPTAPIVTPTAPIVTPTAPIFTPTPGMAPAPFGPGIPTAPVVVPSRPTQPWPEYFYAGPPPGQTGSPTAPVPRYPYYCLDINAAIPTPEGDKRLADLKIGDQVITARFKEIDPDDPNADLIVDTWSIDNLTYEELDITTIVNIRSWEETGRYTINNKIKCTGTHPFIAKEAADGRYYYTRASSLVEGDMLFDGDLEAWVPVTSIDYEPNVRFTVRTLSTEPYDMFFAEGILVHNK